MYTIISSNQICLTPISQNQLGKLLLEARNLLIKLNRKILEAQMHVNFCISDVSRITSWPAKSCKPAYTTQPADNFFSRLKRLIIIFIYTIKNKLIKLKYKSFFFFSSDGLASFSKKNFLIMKH